MRALLVDDDYKLAHDLRVLIPPYISLIHMPDSRAAVEFLYREGPPDAIILDLCLPRYLSELEETEGLRLLDLMQSLLAPDVPVVVLSQFPEEEAGAVCIKHGASAYLEKPCPIDDLVALLRRLTGK
ncbi:MAG: response regulator [bacterium]|jgi:DNA-binding response OmpR family regulator